MGGHILRQKIKLQNMQQISLASMLAAGAAAAATGRADAAIAIMMGTQSSMLNAMLAYQVEEERSADESAVKLLQKTEQSPAGMRNFMKKIDRQNRLNGIAENPYFRHTSRYCRAHQFSEQCGQAIPFSGTGTAQQRISADKSQIVRLYGRTAQSAAKISAERQIDTGALCAGNRFFQNAQT